MGTERHFKMGSFYRICDRTGFATRAERTRKEWTGLIVRDAQWEPRQPQDFVKGVIDDQTVPQPRPRQVDAYDGPLHTYVTNNAGIGDVTITVNNTSRMYAGDSINLELDNGATLQTTIVKIWSDGVKLTIGTPLTWSISVNNDLTNLSAISPPAMGSNAFGQPE